MPDIEKCIKIANAWQKKHANALPSHYTKQQLSDGCFVMSEEQQFSPGEEIKIKLHPPLVAFCPSLPHKHSFFEITYVYCGRFAHQIEGNTYIQTPEQLILMNLNTKHNPYLLDEHSIVFNILLRKSIVEKTFLQLLSRNYLFFHFFLDSLYELNSPGKLLTFELTPALKRVIEDIVSEYYEEREFFQEIMVSHLLRLFSELSRIYYSQLPEQTNADTPETISQILLYIQRNYATVTLTSVSEYFGYSSRHMSRLLHENTGKTFLQLLNQYKIQSACIYLKKSDLPVAQIGILTGFQDSSYFYKIFKREMKMTISQYRQKCKEESIAENELP